MQVFRGALIAGIIAAVIWIAITLAVGGFSAAAVWGGGAAFLVGVALISYLISTMLRSGRTRR